MFHPLRSSLASVFILCCALVAAASSPAPGREKVSQLPFAPSERLVYEGEFSKLLLRGINVLEMRFSAERVAAREDKPPHLRLVGEALSKGWFGKLFGLSFRYRSESLIDAGRFAVLRTDKVDEQGERVRESVANFDRDADRVTWTECDPRRPEREPRVVSSNLDGALHDVVSLLYYLRTQDLKPGRSFEIPVSDSGAVYRLPVRVAEGKRLKTIVGEVETVRVEADVFGRLVDEEGEFCIWFTADARRLPVSARISARIGTLDLKLKQYSE